MMEEEVESEAHVPLVIVLVLCAGAIVVLGFTLALIWFGLHLLGVKLTGGW